MGYYVPKSLNGDVIMEKRIDSPARMATPQEKQSQKMLEDAFRGIGYEL